MRRIVAALTGLALLAASGLVRADELTTLQGEQISGEITGIDEAGKLSGKNLPANLELDGVRRIVRPATNAAKGTIALDLLGGGRILGTSLTVEKEKFHVGWNLSADKVVLPIDVVRAVRFKLNQNDDSFEAALAKPSADTDRVFVEIDGKLTILTGLVESLSAENIVFQYEGAQQTLPIEKLYGIVVAQVGKPVKATSGVTVELADGSRIAGVAKSLKDGQLALSLGPAAMTLPWPAVKSMTVRSSRLAFLSDLDPVETDEHPLLVSAQPWQRDLSVLKKPLTIGERKFDRGIGVHSYSKLVFDVSEGYDVFTAVIGLDAAAERRGDCVFVVLADGRELARERVTGATAAKELKLDIKNVKQLALVVEPGEGLDLADLADWADARVMKQK
jgi:hypothetical protein